MGLIFIEAKVKGNNKKSQKLRFLVDSGAKYSVLPEKVWKMLGLKPKRWMSFVLADSTEIRRKISEAYFVLSQGEGHCPVILGEGNDKPLLGIFTLENLGLMLNPFDRELRSMQMSLC